MSACSATPYTRLRNLLHACCRKISFHLLVLLTNTSEVSVRDRLNRLDEVSKHILDDVAVLEQLML